MAANSALLEKLDKQNDENAVRMQLAAGHYTTDDIGTVQEWLRRKDEERAIQRHSELLNEIRRPHWSVTPGFVVGVVAMVAACIAAYPVLFPPTQTPATAVAPSTQTTLPASNTPSNSQPPSSHSQPTQSDKPRK